MRLAYEWGFSRKKPNIVLPGNGGVKTDIFLPDHSLRDDTWQTVINPRGFRAYVCNDTFFQAIPFIKHEIPNTRFICTAMSGNPTAEKWVKKHMRIHMLIYYRVCLR